MLDRTAERAVSARGLTYRYATGGGVSEVDLDVAAGEMVAVVGPSGSGKSTLLALLGLILQLQVGTLSVAGNECAALPARARDELRRQHIGIILQDLGLLPFLSAWQNAASAFGPQLKKHEARAREYLATVHIREFADAPVADLSGGQRQRVAVARAAVKEPALILADEPTGSLDGDNAGAVISALRAAATAGAGIVLVTHDLAVADRCDRTLSLRDGSLAADGPYGEPVRKEA